jgi:SAM-dependent methyltransferase
MEESSLLGAYLLYYWPVSYLQVSLAIASLPTGRGAPRRVLDLGAGPGPAAAAFLDSGSEEIVLVDSSEKALGLAASLLSAGDKRHVECLRADLESGAALPAGPFDAIVACHSLNELWKGKPNRLDLRLAFLEEVSSLLSPEGFLLLVEPSLLSTSRDLLAIRDGLSGKGFTVLGPCLRQAACPALAEGPNLTCHAEVPWSPPEPLASLARQAGLDRESVKMTWFGLAPSASAYSAPTHVAPARDLPSQGSSAQADAEALVVSDPMLNKAGRVRYILCGDAGRFAFSAKRGDAEATQAGFFTLARYDRIGIRDAQAREGGALGFGPGTRLAFLRRAAAIEMTSPTPQGKGAHGQA